MGLAPIVLTSTTLRVAVTTARVLAEGGSTGRLIRDSFGLNSLGRRKQVMVKGVGLKRSVIIKDVLFIFRI